MVIHDSYFLGISPALKHDKLCENCSKDGVHEGPKAFGRVISHRITVQGFIAGDTGPDGSWEKFDTVAPKLIKWRMEGKIKFHEDIQKGGPSNYLNSLRRLFTGANTGKLILSMY